MCQSNVCSPYFSLRFVLETLPETTSQYAGEIGTTQESMFTAMVMMMATMIMSINDRVNDTDMYGELVITMMMTTANDDDNDDDDDDDDGTYQHLHGERQKFL